MTTTNIVLKKTRKRKAVSSGHEVKKTLIKRKLRSNDYMKLIKDENSNLNHLGWRSKSLKSSEYIQKCNNEENPGLDMERIKRKNLKNTKWEGLVAKTFEHPTFKYTYNFPSKEIGWASTSKCLEKGKSLSIVALDCEMCVTVDPDTYEKNSKALVRVSLIDGENLEKIHFDACVFQPEVSGHIISSYKTDIHGITPEQIENAKYSITEAQKKMLTLISKDTIVVGHSVHYDLAALRISHHRVIDTSFLFRRLGDSTGRAIPALRDLCKFLLKKDMSSAHNSCVDAKISMEAAIFALEHGYDRLVERLQKEETLQLKMQLRIHNIPKGLSELDLHNFFCKSTLIVPITIKKITWKLSNISRTGQSKVNGATTAIFSSSELANMAFDSLEGIENIDTVLRQQKRLDITLENGKIFRRVQIGKMMPEVTDAKSN